MSNRITFCVSVRTCFFVCRKPRLENFDARANSVAVSERIRPDFADSLQVFCGSTPFGGHVPSEEQMCCIRRQITMAQPCCPTASLQGIGLRPSLSASGFLQKESEYVAST